MVRKPMAFGRVSHRAIADPMYEPAWIGRRVLAVVEGGAADVLDELGVSIVVPDELLAAIGEAVLAGSAVVDGYIVDRLPPDSAGMGDPMGMDAVEGSGSIARRMFIGGAGRNTRKEALERALAAQVQVGPDEDLTFVAVDLVELDGAELRDVPLLERKRLLESVLQDGDLVRRTVSVKAPVDVWFAQWRTLGFSQVAIKGANGRYRPGEKAPDWTVVPIPSR
jgi:hypothetical protein